MGPTMFFVNFFLTPAIFWQQWDTYLQSYIVLGVGNNGTGASGRPPRPVYTFAVKFVNNLEDFKNVSDNSKM
jgi:hypothetical protein